MSMIEIENRIFVSEELMENEYSYMFGDNKDKPLTFQYYQVKKDRATICNVGRNYRELLDFARYRRSDKRYRNYEFFITL